MRETFRSVRRSRPSSVPDEYGESDLDHIWRVSLELGSPTFEQGKGRERKGQELGLKVPLALVAVVVAVSSFSVPVWSDATGLASMHDLRRERGRICMSDHWHYGTSGPQKSKSRARRSAIRSWASFVDLEYGSDWARWGRAGSKKAGCSRSSGSWNCDVEARPCK